MSQKVQCPTHLSGLSQTIYLELRGTEGLTRQQIKDVLRTDHAHSSGLEVDEALDELMGHTREHKTRYIWCDPRGRYHIYSGDHNPILRANVVDVVQQRCACEGANYYDILKDLVHTRRFPQDHVLGCLRELQDEGLLIDEGGGKFAICPKVPESTITSMVSLLREQRVGAR